MSSRVIRLIPILSALVLLLPLEARAVNPIVQTIFSTDPAPVVFGPPGAERLYVYTGHDEDNAKTFVMKNWWVFSTADMVNWTAHGSPLSLASFPWASRDAWAGQCISREVLVNGEMKTRYFWYVPMRLSTGPTDIGVAVSDSPTGPFIDAIGGPLVANAAIDPTVFIDDDGQAYLYYGNPGLYYVKLKPDMISLDGMPTQVTLDEASGFGWANGKTRFTEGPWLFKRNGLYYMVFSGPIREYIAYSTSPSPTGPWTYRGIILPTMPAGQAGSSFTSHAGIVDFQGKSYLFYHNGALPKGGDYQRSVAVESFVYNSDGTIPEIQQSANGVDPVATLDPYARVEAETIAWESGVELETTSDTDGGLDVTQISNGDYIRVMNVDFGGGAASFDARVASGASGGNIELRLDATAGTLLGTCAVPPTGGAQTWATVSCKVTGAAGIHDLYLVFTGGSGDLFSFNWWKFNTTAGADTQAPSAPSSLTSSAKTASSVSLSWTGSTDDVGVIGYVVLRGSSPAVAVGVTSATAFQVTGLSPSTAYDFSVQAIDAAGNASSATSTLSVTTAADTTPPTAPTGLASSAITQSAATLTWTASTDEVAVTGYAIYTQVGSAARVPAGTTSAATTTFGLTGLSAGTTYTVSVEAQDAAGNHSTAATTTVTTASAPSSGGGGGCGQGAATAWALPALALCLLALRRRREAHAAVGEPRA